MKSKKNENLSYETIHFPKAKDLWDYLSPTSNIYDGYNRSEFVYRGQGNAEWKLLPSLFRNLNKRSLINLAFKKHLTVNQVIVEEFLMLYFFLKSCDQTGIHVPGDTPLLRSLIELKDDALEKYTSHPDLWPTDELMNFLAMAQHHKVPTRLLDWSENPLVAFYFAATSVFNNHLNYKKGDRLAIWVLNKHVAKQISGIKFHFPPGSISSHVSAQSGLFTVHPTSNDHSEIFNPIGLEDKIIPYEKVTLLKLTLPVECSIDLSHYCEQLGINTSKIFPTADGAGLGVLEKYNRSFAQHTFNGWED